VAFVGEAPEPIFRCLDRWGREVVLTRECWDGHITAVRVHLEGLEQVVRETIERPDRVVYDAARPNGECFYRAGVIPAHPTHVLKVMVKYVDEGGPRPRGYVTSAISHNADRPHKSGERHKWP
jgi:hypothetical protein